MGDIDRLWAGAGVQRTMNVSADAVYAVLADPAARSTWAGPLGDHQRCTTVADAVARRFGYVTALHDDGSYAEWRWHVGELADGCEVHVGWVLRSAGTVRGLADRRWNQRTVRGVDAALTLLAAVAGAVAVIDVAPIDLAREDVAAPAC